MTIIVSYPKTHQFSTRRANKYGAKKTEYNGVVYDSKREASYAQELDLKKNEKQPAERVVHVERQWRIRLNVNDVKICDHIIDFWVEYADGHIELVEVKGYETAVWKIKRKLLEATFLKEHPKIEYIIIK